MNLRLSSLRAMFIHQGKGRLSAAAAVAAATFALAGVGMNSALAAPSVAASAPDAASVSYANGGQFTVKPGQSLNDVAIAVTQSHDRATLARASRALFDANPNAFMSHDPSRMRLGAVLTVPVLDASGVLAASAAAATGSGASAPVSAASASAVAPVGTMAATTATGAAAATGAASAASAVAQVNAAATAAASAASAAAHAAAPVTSAVPGTASAVTATGSATPGSGATTAGGAVASAPVAGSQTASPASGAHEWSGSIQPSASESAAGASASAAGSAATAMQAASQPLVQVSSLQQLLALKNRVLMELQKHGIGGSPVATRAAATGAVAPVAGASSSAAAASGHGATATSVSNDGGISQAGLSIAAAIGAALVILLAALRMRRRKRDANAVAEVSAADSDAVARSQANDSHDVASARAQGSADDTSDVSADVSVSHAAALAAAEHEAAEGEAAAREQAEREAAEREAEIHEAAAREAERRAAESAAAERAAAEHEASEQTAAERASAEHAAAERDNFNSATTAASLAAAAELGAEALPLTPLDPVDESFQHEPPAHRLQWDDEPAPSAPTAPQTPSAEHQSQLDVPPPPAIDFTQQPVEPRDTPTPFGQPYADASAHPLPDTTLPPVPLTHLDPAHNEATYQPSYELHQPTEAATPDGASTFSEPTPLSQAQHPLTAPTEFPRDAVDAFSALDMPLPPRIESPFEGLRVPASLTTQPVASPETTAQQALAPHDPDDVPHIADEITAGTAGHAAVAGLGATGFGAMGGLGAAGFGALKLDFDLELPPSPSQPLPAFTPADLSRIARNKLDLAAEYIDLGDLSGARSLINEVIEANDPATRNEARALLSTLAPLS